MIVSSLVAATIAATQPAPAPQPMTIPAPAAEKKMACCEKMANGASETRHAGEHAVSDAGCECCKGMKHEDKAAAGASPEGHASHDH